MTILAFILIALGVFLILSVINNSYGNVWNYLTGNIPNPFQGSGGSSGGAATK